MNDILSFNNSPSKLTSVRFGQVLSLRDVRHTGRASKRDIKAIIAIKILSGEIADPECCTQLQGPNVAVITGKYILSQSYELFTSGKRCF